MLNLLKQLNQIFTQQEKRKIYFLLAGMVLMACFEVVGIALILPFMAMLLSPDLVFKYKILSNIYNYFAFASTHNFLIFIGLSTFAVIFCGNIFSGWMLAKMLMFSNMQEASLSVRLFKKYLNSPYQFFLKRHASDLSKRILADVSAITSLILTPGIQLISRLFTTFIIMVFLIVLNPILALVIGVSVLGAYLVAYAMLRNKITYFSKLLSQANTDRHKIIKESFDAIKDVKFMNLENTIAHSYEQPAFNHALGIAKGNIMAQIPRYVPETVAFGGVLLYLVAMLMLNKNMADLIPILTVYVYAGIRLLPAVQQAYTAFSLVKLGTATLNTMTVDLAVSQEPQGIDAAAAKTAKITYNSMLNLKNIKFSYPDSEKIVLHDLSLEITAGSVIALAGRSGSGKTTVVDIILGLLQPQQGTIEIDQQVIDNNNLRAWQAVIGYVPQQVYLMNKTIAENIALGVALNSIDMAQIKYVAQQADIADFIESELSDGYLTELGGSGVRLSGGQQQRIGIARALYRNPRLLVLDEATSALDNITEKQIFENIVKNRKKQTIILITHRLKTLDICDLIYVFEQGKGLVAKGGYNELLNSSEIFNNMLNTQEVL